MGKQLARPPGAPRPLCVCFTVGACTHPSYNVIAILRAIGASEPGRGPPQDFPRLFPYCLRVCLALLCVMFIAYHVALDVSFLSACLPRFTLCYVYCLPRCA